MLGALLTKISLRRLVECGLFIFIALFLLVPVGANAQVVKASVPTFPDKTNHGTEDQLWSLVWECFGVQPNGLIPVGSKCEAVAGNEDNMKCVFKSSVATAGVPGLGGVVGYPECEFTYPKREVSPDPWTVTPKFFGDGIKGEGEGANGESVSTNSTDAPDACNLLNGNALTCIQSFAGKIGASILLIVVMAFSAILGLVGGILNWVMLITVFQYSTYFGNSEGMLVAWSVLRDLGNIVLLFGFIFIGLQTILNIGHFSVSKALPRLVIFAILINFSLFVSEAVVDVSNVFASTFYTQAGQVDCTDNVNMEKCANDGIAGKIMKEAGLSGIFSVDSQLGGLWGAANGSDMFFLYFCLIILVLIMIVVFIAAIILFVIRAVVLMLLLVTSPIGFVGMAIPQLEEFSSMWWKKLISNAIFAPVFLLMLLVGLKIMDGASGIFNAGGASLTVALMQGSTGTGGIFILYSLIIGFMIAALMSAKSLGAVGASFAVSSSSKMVGSASFGALGFAGRRTVGSFADKVRNSEGFNKLAQQRPGLARIIAKPLDYGKNASFDARALSPLKNVAKKAGMEFDRPDRVKKGIHGIEEQKVKEREDLFKNTKPTEEQSGPGKEIQKQLDGVVEEQKQFLSQYRNAIETARKNIEEARKRGDTAGITAGQQELNNRIDEFEAARRDDTARNEQIRDLTQKAKAWKKRGEQEKMEEHVKGLESAGPNITNLYLYGQTLGPHADHEAIDKIKKNAGQTDIEKALKTLGERMEGGGADTHTAPRPAPAPAGGGHGPAAAPH